MNAELYLANEFLANLGSTWDDNGTPRNVCICANVVRVEDTRDDGTLGQGVIVVYGQNGDGEFQQDVSGTMITAVVGFDIVAFLPHSPSLYRFQQRFHELFHEQPTRGRCKLATLAATSYNEDLRAYAAQWRVLVRA